MKRKRETQPVDALVEELRALRLILEEQTDLGRAVGVALVELATATEQFIAGEGLAPVDQARLHSALMRVAKLTRSAPYHRPAECARRDRTKRSLRRARNALVVFLSASRLLQD